MSNAYAVIKSLSGQVFAVSAEGVRRQVFEGEVVFAGDRLETDAAGSVTLELPNGEELTLGSSASWQAGEFAGADAVQMEYQSITDLEQAIADGFDPTTQLDPTAAGQGAGGTGGAGGGGHSAVMLSETGERVEAVTGFETEGLSAATSAPEPDTIGVSATGLANDTSVSAPTVSLLIDSGASSSDSITNSGALTIGGTEAGATIEYSTDGGKTWSPTFTPAEGNNTVSVRQTDVAGNTSGATTISFVLDTQIAAPSVSLTSDTGASGSDSITNSGALTIGGTEAGAAIEYSIDGGKTWTSTFTPVEGNNSVSVRQTDVAGNTSGATTVSFTLDTQVAAPRVSLTSDTGASGSDSITNAGALTIGGTEAGATIEYSTDGGNTWTSTFTPVEGSNTVAVRQTDVAGNTSGASTISFVLDTQAPTLAITIDPITADNTLNAAERAGDTVTVTGKVTGEVAIDDPIVLTLGSSRYEGKVIDLGNAELGFSIDVGTGDLADNKEISASVSTTDAAGNVGTATDSETYSVDTGLPAPTVTLDASITADDVINASEAAGTVAITGTVGGDAKVGDTVTLTVNGKTFTGQVVTGNTFSINVPGADLVADADKTIDARISTTDAAGNVGTATDS
ncbi:retention module-containing protein, partial [Pseudomonas sp. NPDC047963]